ncbi:hypothetical protein A0H81_13872 [Grifola frondosa]|uniref:Uncharacterized protein n=1 Tax=Grifola frondosa TaxID=5627 RepID=A0A1C7LQY7_GRIFR|nr:hypothetical protein A0H81_13872 [Grifola frondosa]
MEGIGCAQVVGWERFCFKKEDWDVADFNENDKEMLRILYVDAQAANDGYEAHVMSRPPSTMKGLE